MSIAVIQWISPWWALGLLAIAAPIAAHLLSRRASRTVIFPSIRFIRQAVAQRQKRTRPRNLILLILRCLIIALLVAAFTQPIWYSKHHPAPGRGIGVVLILDRSASMNRVQRGVSLFEHARRQVVERLKELDPSRDRATVILLDAGPRLLLPQPSGNFTELAQMLGSVDPTFQRADLNAAMLLASSAISDAADRPDDQSQSRGSRSAQIEVFSDMQANQWQSISNTGDIALISHRIGEPAPNLAIYNARVEPSKPIVGQRTILSVEVGFFDNPEATVRSVPIRLHLEGYNAVTRSVRLKPGHPITISFPFRAIKPGILQARVGLDESLVDGLQEDNSTGLFIEVQRQRRVTLITDASVDDPKSASYFLARGLAPDSFEATDRAEQEKPAGGIGVTVMRSGALSDQQRIEAGTVVIAEAASLSQDALNLLYSYLNAGGGVVWIIDSPDAAESLRRWNQLEPNQVLTPIAPRTDNAWMADANLQLSSGRFESPILDVFDGPSRSGLLQQRFTKVMRGRPGPSASVLLHFEDGSPAMAGQWIGPGRLVIFAASMTPSGSPIVKQAPFVPLIHQLVGHLTPGAPAQPNPHPSDQALATVPMALTSDQVRVSGPDGQTVGFDVQLGDKSTAIQFERLEQPGPYILRRAGTELPIAGVQVEIDPLESDLRSTDDPSETSASSKDNSHAPIIANSGTTMALWPWLILIVLGIALVEQIVAATAGDELTDLEVGKDVEPS